MNDPDATARKPPLQLAAETLYSRGVRLILSGGHYVLNYVKPIATAEFRCDDLDEALAYGLAMPPRPAELPPLGPMGKPGGSKRSQMYQQNKKIAARRARANAKEKT